MWMTFLLLKIICNKFFLLPALLLFGFGLDNTEPETQFQFEKLIEAETHFFTIDSFENIFFLESGTIVKVDKKSSERNYYSSSQYGYFDVIDSSDPFNILAFSSDIGDVVFLDKNLIEKEPFIAHKQHYREKPELACNSRFEGFWVYYPYKWQFLRINRNNQIIASTLQIDKLEYDFTQPCFMVETGSRLFVSDKNNGILVFDVFGGFLFKIPLKNVCEFQVKENSIIYFTEEYLCIYDFFLKNERVYLLPDDIIKMGQLKYPYVYLLKQNGIKKFKTNIEFF